MNVTKTPATILHELFIAKLGTVPQYDVFKDKSDINPSIFTAKVMYDNITAVGKGQSKKVAKQNAAKAMLKELEKHTTNPEVIIKDTSNAEKSKLSPNNVVIENTIQELKNFCVKYNLDGPSYTKLNFSDVPNNSLYKIKCIVSTFKITGLGVTEKQAKQDASQKMIHQLKQIFCVMNLGGNIGIKKIDEVKILENNSKTPLKTSVSNITNKNLEINYDLKTERKPKELTENLDYSSHNFPLMLEQFCKMIEKCYENISHQNILKLKKDFKYLLNLANIDFNHMLLNHTAETDSFILIIQLNTVPHIIELSSGKTKEDAEIGAMLKVIEALKVFFK